jgi:hypothetical protein
VSDLITAADIEQAPTVPASVRQIMSHPAFAIGIEDIRKGKSFNPPDSHYDGWAYERGRLFGAIAPLDMPLTIRGKINPKALRLCEAAFERRLVI